jgi:hypothetical protein
MAVVFLIASKRCSDVEKTSLGDGCAISEAKLTARSEQARIKKDDGRK